MIYMGKDKYENEELLKFYFPEDIWFHVDNLSSAHVYLRLNKEESFENIEQILLDECCQLVKENSIDGKNSLFHSFYKIKYLLSFICFIGSKKDSVKIVYTPADNLLKQHDMEIGQVSFHNLKKVLLKDFKNYS